MAVFSAILAQMAREIIHPLSYDGKLFASKSVFIRHIINYVFGSIRNNEERKKRVRNLDSNALSI